MQTWKLQASRRTGIHDVAPAPDGGVWFTAQASGHLGWFDPATGRTELVALGSGSSPHGVVQGPDKAAWVTDSGQNAMVKVTWPDRKQTVSSTIVVIVFTVIVSIYLFGVDAVVHWLVNLLLQS